MLIDTHAHLNFNSFKNDTDEVIDRAIKNNTWLINVGSQIDTSRRAVAIAGKYKEGVYAAVGLHPIHLIESDYVDPEEDVEFKTKAEEFDFEKYKELAQNNKVVAIGEMGLDYYHLPKTGDVKQIKNKQKKTFLAQLNLAIKLDLPTIIHCREAHKDLFFLLEDVQRKFPDKKLKGVVHCFSGSWQDGQKYLEMGLLISFTGVITYSDSYNKVILNTPLEKIMVETDCPYLAPVPYRGQRNEPLYVKYVAERIAEIKGVSFTKVAEATTKNAREFFGI